MANTSNGESLKNETSVNFQQGSCLQSDQVEISINPTKKSHIKHKKTRYRCLPKLFERSNGNLFNPKFDSEILESYLTKCYLPQTRRMFNKTTYYVGIASFCWALYFAATHLSFDDQWEYFMAGSIVMLFITIGFIVFAHTSYFEKHSKIASLLLAMILAIAIQLPFVFEDPAISSLATFCGVVEILIMLYSFFPINLFAAAGFGGFLSVSYEIFTALRYPEMQGADFIISKILLHLVLHITGTFIYILSNTRARSNFSKIGQSVSAQLDLKVEREIKEKMIHSLMPPAVAKSVMDARPSQEDEEAESSKKRKAKHVNVRGEIIFRKFQMDEMNNVSILFADIVGFTKMSSNKTAERLVGLLNDLFGRFDHLCTASGCEKISTLGDCYYCVSGCPDKCPEHAKNCVEMGLNMVMAIQAFDEDHSEEVNMRVGIHTGTVLCGIVGTRRFKFDVWSNDVTLANTMESSGEPGKVHISEATREFLVDEYEMTEGEEVADMRGAKELIEHYDPEQSSFTIKHREETRNIKTYFITGRKPGNEGIPGLEQLATQRPEDIKLLKRTKGGGNHHTEESPRVQRGANVESKVPSNEVENGSSAAAADLFSQRIPDIMAEEDGGDNPEKSPDDAEGAGADSNLLGGRSEAVSREQDKLLVSLIETKDENHKAFFNPNINRLWLTFEPEMENMYRHEFKDSHLFQENMLSSPRYQMVFEAGIALIEVVVLAVCCHVMFNFARTAALSAVTVIGCILQLLIFLDGLTNIFYLEAKKANFPQLMKLTTNWYFRNAVGVIMATIPSALVYVSLSCDLITSNNWHDRFFIFGLVVALLQYCNYTMLRSLVKTVAAVIMGCILIVLLFAPLCSFPITTTTVTSSSSPQQVYQQGTNNSLNSTNASSYITSTNSSFTSNPSMSEVELITDDHLFSGENTLRFEIILSMLLLLLLIGMLNHEFEMSYRLSFNAGEKAQKDKENMQLNKDQADWLLHNIIPAHLADLFKMNRSYSMNHQDVGVIFATIVNFNEFYDEMYAGGREYLRVLNELVSDYEVMLNETCFKDVEKIKTISATFMAAAGLNESSRAQNKHPHAHLFALMDFATELQNVVMRFNESIFNFNFILNIGYNYGPVTAGVIGTTKLLYDIWGDTVNIASRMYSTGEADRIQVPQATAELLEEKFEFSYRDEIFVKGKGMMKTFLLETKRPGAMWE